MTAAVERFTDSSDDPISVRSLSGQREAASQIWIRGTISAGSIELRSRPPADKQVDGAAYDANFIAEQTYDAPGRYYVDASSYIEFEVGPSDDYDGDVVVRVY